MVLIFIFLLINLIKVNCITTKALSPLGNSNENYEKIKDEFGEEFSKFIKDNSIVKIYNEDNDILIRIGDADFKIEDNWDITNITSRISETLYNIKNKVEDIIYS